MDEVAPSDVATLNAQRVAGILTAGGGAASHSAIIARALGIPAIVGAGPVCSAWRPTPCCCRWRAWRAAGGAERYAARTGRASAPRGRNASAWPMSDVWSRRSPVTAIRWRSLPTSAPPADARGGGARCRGHRPAAHRTGVHEPCSGTGSGDPEAEYRRVLEALEGRPGGAHARCRRRQAAAVLADAGREPFLGARHSPEPAAPGHSRNPAACLARLRRRPAAADHVSMVGNIEWRTAKALVDRLRVDCRWPTCRWAS